jgi:hypothetical protein
MVRFVVAVGVPLSEIELTLLVNFHHGFTRNKELKMDYTNRKGDRYFVYEGKTKTGKPKYYVSRKPTSDGGTRIASMPDEFELFEDPSSHVVTVRRRKPSRIKQSEADMVRDLAIKLSSYTVVQALIDGDFIVLYTPDQDSSKASRMLGGAFGLFSSVAASVASRGRYTAVLRFKLVDADKRLFESARYFFRSSMEGWHSLSSRPAPLETLCQKYLPLLGEDSFYEIF